MWSQMLSSNSLPNGSPDNCSPFITVRHRCDHYTILLNAVFSVILSDAVMMLPSTDCGVIGKLCNYSSGPYSLNKLVLKWLYYHGKLCDYN